MRSACISFLSLLLFLQIISCTKHEESRKDQQRIDLAGEWDFQVDSLDKGVEQRWFDTQLSDKISLPGSMTTNGKGDDITINTPWTGSIFDSAWFKKPEYDPYRQPGNISVPFWLQPVKYYKGAAWYQRTVNIPDSWTEDKVLFIERSHWETTLWVDTTHVGMRNSLGTPHVFDLSKLLTPGTHRITVRIDNRIKDFNVGQNSHSITDHTQGNWNGMIGQLFVASRPAVQIGDVKIFPDIKSKQLTVRMTLSNSSAAPGKATVQLLATADDPGAEKLSPVEKEIDLSGDSVSLELTYPMGDKPLLWDEFHPNLYALTIRITTTDGNADEKKITFGMREFSAQGTQFTINGNLTFLRGTLECAIFPKTGYPAMDEAEWTRIFNVCRAHGLNHVRFHSWTPPEAAFIAADKLGFYLQVECSSWANFGSSVGDGNPIDRYIMDESDRVVNEYGNHPSFCMMAYGNEPKGGHHKEYLTTFVKYWQGKDSRRLYTTGAGWPVIAESDYNSTSDPRIQRWEEGLKSIINGQPPRSDYDWTSIIAKLEHPTVSHEIGQWCVYPDFKEIAKYDGALKAKNFGIFKEALEKNGMGPLADSFLLASGKLQALCYKADIEAALRTPGFGGFQLLDLHDFPGQGTALVGVLSPFWESKGYITAEEYSAFCNATVPLVRFSKMVYLSSETLKVPVEIAHFGEAPLKDITPSWEIKDASGKTLFEGNLKKTDIPLGNAFKLGEIKQSLVSVKEPSRLTLTVSVDGHKNSWDVFVYPAVLRNPKDGILVTQQLDTKAKETLDKGGKVLLTIKKGSVKPDKGGSVAIGFSSIFWNTAWTNGQAPHTLGILCDPQHPAFAAFPTEYHSNWQWWDAMSHSNAVRLDAIDPTLKPIVRVIDDWVTARPLGLIFECRVGKGTLLVSSIDLLSEQNKRPEARQLLYSLKGYMAGDQFHPAIEVPLQKIEDVFFTAEARGR